MLLCSIFMSFMIFLKFAECMFPRCYDLLSFQVYKALKIDIYLYSFNMYNLYKWPWKSKPEIYKYIT